ncbi:MAG: murein biosynthesis integral membrane protein MurJ [Spirochaetaceae bacterium]|jgi:putative peptidoglycan lipid II flippase|nr:murein biosynthesis integral membrane protein MurJ [Spirochaetaceae bacterium]
MPVKQPPSLLRHGSILSLLTLASRVLGLVREMTKAALLGTGALSDAFSVAFIIPNLFRRLFAEGSISVAFIPVFKSTLLDNDAAKTREFLACFFSVLSFFVSIACGAGILAAPALVRLFGDGAFDETVFLTRLMFPFLAFVSVAALFQGVLNSVNVFAPAGFAPVLLNVSCIGCAWLLKDVAGNGARAMAIGVLAGGALEAAIQLPFVLKSGFRFGLRRLGRALKNKQTRAVFALIGPTIIGMAAYQLNDLVSSALACRAGLGVLSSLQYSLRLQELILGVFAVSIGTVLLPKLTEAAQKSDWAAYNKQLTAAVNVIALITVPVTVFSLLYGEQLIRILFQFRNFDESSVRLTLTAFNCHIAGLFFIALNRILAPAFYARKDTVSPTAAGIVSFAVNIALAAFLAGPLRGGGIALALSVSGAVNTVVLCVLMRRRAAAAPDEPVPAFWVPVRYVGKVALVAAVCGAPLVLAKKYAAAILGAAGIAGRPALITETLVCGVLFVALCLVVLAVSGDPYIRALRRRR